MCFLELRGAGPGRFHPVLSSILSRMRSISSSTFSDASPVLLFLFFCFFFFFRSLPLALDCSGGVVPATSPSVLLSVFPRRALPLFPRAAVSVSAQPDLSPFTTGSSSRSSMFISSKRLLTRTPSFPAPPGRRTPSSRLGPSSSASSSSRRSNCRALGPMGSWPRCSPSASGGPGAT